MAKKKVKVAPHERDGVMVEEHERVIDTKDSLSERIKKDQDDKAKEQTLFGDEDDTI